ncbi:MAG: exonuclease domain-containing protein, partial [Firmicutes bacterium]|nr:exonuclease domain-containing protein [Bacillota bacterium]
MPDQFAVVDLETTGLDIHQDAVIQVAIVRYDHGETSYFSTFVNPQREVPEFVRQLTGFANIDFSQAPTIDQVKEEIARFIGSRTVVGHNIQFDVAFLKRAGIEVSETVDTLDWARIAFPIRSSYRLGDLVPAVDKHMHDARVDVDQTLQLVWNIHRALSELPRITQMDLARLFGSAWDWWQTDETPSAVGSVFDQKSPELVDNEELLQQPNLPSALQWLASDGQVGQSLDHFEVRPGQRAMLEAVDSNFSCHQILLAEAGTGTGKSLAYLTPAVLRALGAGQRVVIATHTLALQEQLWQNDVPRVIATLPIKTAMLKGRGRYACLLKADEVRKNKVNDALGLSWADRLALGRLLTFLQATQVGDVEEYNPTTESARAQWADVVADRDACAGPRCPYADACYMRKARRTAEQAHLVIVNHALLAAHMIQQNVLPPFEHVIIDEAHHFAEVVERTAGFEFVVSEFGQQFQEWMQENSSLFRQMIAGIPSAASQVSRLADQMQSAGQLVKELQTELVNELPASAHYRQSQRVTAERWEIWQGQSLPQTLERCAGILKQAARTAGDMLVAAQAAGGDTVKEDAAWLRFQTGTEDLIDMSEGLTQWGPPADDAVCWWNICRYQETTRVVLRRGPLEVAQI